VTAAKVLTRRGVEVITGTGVARIEPGCVVLADGRRVMARTVIWAAGVKASPVAAMLGVPLQRGGRIVVDAHLAVPGRPGVYAIGDIAGDADHPLPQVAQPAIQGGRYVAGRITRALGSGSAPAAPSAAPSVAIDDVPFEYHDKGSMATIGRHAAVAEFPNGRRLTGPLGWLAWLGLHIVYLMGFRNRANVLLNWAWNYLTYDHAARLLTGESESVADPRT
jgi:NADH dehydrogenase